MKLLNDIDIGKLTLFIIRFFFCICPNAVAFIVKEYLKINVNSFNYTLNKTMKGYKCPFAHVKLVKNNHGNYFSFT